MWDSNANIIFILVFALLIFKLIQSIFKQKQNRAITHYVCIQYPWFENEKSVGFSLFFLCIIEWFNEAKCGNILSLNDVHSKFFHITLFFSFIFFAWVQWDHEQNFTIIACYYTHAVSSHMNFKYINCRLNTRQQQKKKKNTESHDNNELNETKKKQQQWASTKKASHSHRILNFFIQFLFLSQHYILFILFSWWKFVCDRVSFSLLHDLEKKKLNTASHF